MDDEFAAIVAGVTLHAAVRPVVIVRNVRNRATTRTLCGRDVTYPGPGFGAAQSLCATCLPGQDLEDLRALNPGHQWPEAARTDTAGPSRRPIN